MGGTNLLNINCYINATQNQTDCVVLIIVSQFVLEI